MRGAPHVRFSATISGIQGSQPAFTVLLATKKPTALADTQTTSALQEELTNTSSTITPGAFQSADLAAGVDEAEQERIQFHGIRVVIIISDGDGDITRQEFNHLKTQMAEARVLCCSVPLAEQHDFLGTKARNAGGVKLRGLASFSGGGQHETHWQSRKSDPKVLASTAARIPIETLITFEIPAAVKTRSAPANQSC
jgi:hypothetical protein